MAVLGLCCCAGLSLVVVSGSYSRVALQASYCGAYVVAEHGHAGFGCCGPWAQ